VQRSIDDDWSKAFWICRLLDEARGTESQRMNSMREGTVPGHNDHPA
jgi:hypothetical protein